MLSSVDCQSVVAGQKPTADGIAQFHATVTYMNMQEIHATNDITVSGIYGGARAAIHSIGKPGFDELYEQHVI